MSTEKTPIQDAPTTDQRPVFSEIENMNQAQAVDVLIQAANLAQGSGRLSIRDSVMLAKAIDIIKPGII
jgi:hypothetical protein